MMHNQPQQEKKLDTLQHWSPLVVESERKLSKARRKHIHLFERESILQKNHRDGHFCLLEKKAGLGVYLDFYTVLDIE